jgi:NAD(P)-dependent dehydrogenase (short-subunit alcohol dehydrogenase family)
MTLTAALQGKVILVSGAGRPAGRSLALALAQSGAALALHDLALLPLEETAQQVQALGAVCRTYVADGGKGLPVRNLLDEVLNDFERLDGVVHAIFVRPQGRLLDLDEWDWQRSLELNLTGPLLLLQNAAPLLQEQGGGGFLFVYELEDGPAAAAAQALRALAENAARELMPYNIRCSAVSAGEAAALAQAGQQAELAARLAL